MKLLLIDGLNLVRRIYEAIPGDNDSVERAEGAETSSVKSLQRAIKETQPTHALCIFEATTKTWRHDIYSEYKQNRSETPRSLRERLPLIRSAVERSGIPTIMIDNQEADDVIASLVHKLYDKEGIQVVILSTDKDLLQLVRQDRIIVRNHFNGEKKNEQWILDKYNITPSQVPDFLAMIGDKSDNIPGIPGIGESRASDLLETYGSLDEILFMRDVIAGKIGESIRNNTELARLSKQLTTLRSDIHVGVNLSDLRLHAKSSEHAHPSP